MIGFGIERDYVGVKHKREPRAMDRFIPFLEATKRNERNDITTRYKCAFDKLRKLQYFLFINIWLRGPFRPYRWYEAPHVSVRSLCNNKVEIVTFFRCPRCLILLTRILKAFHPLGEKIFHLFFENIFLFLVSVILLSSPSLKSSCAALLWSTMLSSCSTVCGAAS